MVGAFRSLLVVVVVQHGYHIIGGFEDWGPGTCRYDMYICI